MWATVRQALIPSRPRQIIWAVRIIIAVAAAILILVLARSYGFVSSDPQVPYMTPSEIIDALLRLAEILTAWPVILLVILIGFRKPIGAFLNRYIPILLARLRTATVGVASGEFGELRNLQSVFAQGEAPGLPSENPLSENQSLAAPEGRRKEGIDIRKERKDILEESRRLFIVHVLTPTDIPGQKYSVYIYVKRPDNEETSDVRKAEFYFGKSWRNQIFTGKHEGKVIGVRTAAYGEFLCTCRVTFQDGHEVMLYRHIDFEMASLYAGNPASGGVLP
jgi:hypothetical protein